MVWCPDIELALVALGVRIQCRVIAARRMRHVAQHPVGRFPGDAAEKLVASGHCSLRAHRKQLPVVVQHLLEVRDHPIRVHRVTAEAAAELVVEAALGHARQRERGHVQRLQVRMVAVRRLPPGAQQELEVHRMRELRRIAKPAKPAVEVALQRCPRLRERRAREFEACRGRRRQQFTENLHQRVALACDVRAVLGVVRGDPLQHVAKSRHAVFRLHRKVRSAEKRPMVAGRQEHRQRPAAAALRQHLVRGLVDAVEVRTFLAVDLDVDERRVHHRGGGFVLERLVRHDMAPVTGRIADREQDRLVLGPRLLERLGAPRMPVDRVAGVLQQVGAGLAGEPVAMGARMLGMHGWEGRSDRMRALYRNE